MQIYEVLYQHAKHAYFRGSGGIPPRKFLKIRCQKSELGGTSATKTKILVALTLECWIKTQNYHGRGATKELIVN